MFSKEFQMFLIGYKKNDFKKAKSKNTELKNKRSTMYMTTPLAYNLVKID